MAGVPTELANIPHLTRVPFSSPHPLLLLLDIDPWPPLDSQQAHREVKTPRELYNFKASKTR